MSLNTMRIWRRQIIIVLSWPRCCQVVMTPARKQIRPQQIFLCQKKSWEKKSKNSDRIFWDATDRVALYARCKAPQKMEVKKFGPKMAIPKIWFLWGFAVVLNKGGEVQFWQQELDKIQTVLQHFHFNKVKGRTSVSPFYLHTFFQFLFGIKNLDNKGLAFDYH